MRGTLDQQLEELAEEIFELSMMSWSGRNQARKRSEHDISETAFVALETLARHGPMTVGELQRRVEVLPAQMSRIIRSLESKPVEPLIVCSINPLDKRKVDVKLTDAGRSAVLAYRAVKLANVAEALNALDERDRAELIRILRLIRNHAPRST